MLSFDRYRGRHGSHVDWYRPVCPEQVVIGSIQWLTACMDINPALWGLVHSLRGGSALTPLLTLCSDWYPFEIFKYSNILYNTVLYVKLNMLG